MNVAVLLFTYNRSYHTEQVITSLKQNTVLPQKLFVFQDGLEQGCDVGKWEKVNNLINGIDWCDKEIIVSEYNKGLADSIVAGINHVFREYDAVIVLEDDCVTAPNFIRFMIQCFEAYETNKNVYSVSGYSWPITLEKTNDDVYGCGRISSWGWGTWKDRWEQYSVDNNILKRIQEDEIKSRNLAMWGKDCKDILLGNIAGKCNSWAVYWALKVIENEGICINPYESLIQNIGFDNTGTHCGTMTRYRVALSDDVKERFRLTDNIKILNSTKEAYTNLFGSYTAISREDKSKETVLVYGLGKFYFQNEKSMNETYNINAFVDKREKGWFAGKKIIKSNNIKDYEYDKIIIMVYSIQECIKISKELMSQGISYEKILLGQAVYGKFSKVVDNISVLPDGKISVTIEGITVKVSSEDEFNNACEVLMEHIYHYFINNNKKDIVLDVGMNIGDASLYFLNTEKVKKVYSYEPFKETYLAAKDNLQNYLNNSERIEIFQYGISNENDVRKIGFNYNMTCGQSTISDTREKAYEWYASVGLVKAENEEEELIEVRDAVEVFLPIIQKHSDCNIILKMDCEGEEYGIMEKLSREGVLDQISFIMMEWHYKGKEIILRYLEKAGFSYWCNDKRKDMGLIYAYKTI